MEKLQLLLEKYPDQVKSLVDNLYKEKFPKKKKKVYHFKALGKVYDNDIFTKNYIGFLQDISKIHSINLFKLCINEYYISSNPVDFDECHLVRNQVHKITNDIYVSCYSSTDKKISHIKNICEFLGIKLEEL